MKFRVGSPTKSSRSTILKVLQDKEKKIQQLLAKVLRLISKLNFHETVSKLDNETQISNQALAIQNWKAKKC